MQSFSGTGQSKEESQNSAAADALTALGSDQHPTSSNPAIKQHRSSPGQQQGKKPMKSSPAVNGHGSSSNSSSSRPLVSVSARKKRVAVAAAAAGNAAAAGLVSVPRPKPV